MPDFAGLKMGMVEFYTIFSMPWYPWDMVRRGSMLFKDVLTRKFMHFSTKLALKMQPLDIFEKYSIHAFLTLFPTKQQIKKKFRSSKNVCKFFTKLEPFFSIFYSFLVLTFNCSRS